MTTLRDPSTDAGFTLAEVLAALAIFSIAALGIVRLTTENVGAAQRIETRALARIVADNQMVETLTYRGKLDNGVRTGVEDLAGRKWQWTQTVSPTPNALVLQIRVSVSERLADEVPTGKSGRVDAEVSAFETIG